MNSYALALSIVTRLKEKGFTAYFAGGWVRDFIMQHLSSDIDIATDASPDEVTALFPGTIQVGAAFGVVIVPIDGKQFEVATFRKEFDYQDGRRPSRIERATAEEDAKRRDFTINGMFYDPLTDTVIDYVGGREDIHQGMIRTIGNAYDRFFEDRLRMIRAIRFACRFHFHIDPDTERAILQNAESLLPAVSMERIYQEFVKMSRYDTFAWGLEEMQRVGLLPVIFPKIAKVHLTEIKKRAEPFPSFPKETPAFLYLAELFGTLSEEEIIDLGKYLKVPLREVKATLSYELFQRLPPKDDFEKSRFFAHPLSRLSLEIAAAKNEIDLSFYKKERERLKTHIERLETKKPIVSSKDLLELGIPPGKEMGNLLLQAEKIAILENIHDKNEILKRLNLKPDFY